MLTSTRRRIMASIPSKNTKPELSIRRALHALGFRYRTHVKDLPGTPDIVFPKYKAAVQINGCFWHGHNCLSNRPAKNNLKYWLEKTQKNKLRDERNKQGLLKSEWRLMVIWECAIQGKRKLDQEILVSLIENWLLVGSEFVEIAGKGATITDT